MAKYQNMLVGASSILIRTISRHYDVLCIYINGLVAKLKPFCRFMTSHTR